MKAAIAVDTSGRALHALIECSEGRRYSAQGHGYSLQLGRLWHSLGVETRSRISFGTNISIEREQYPSRSATKCFEVSNMTGMNLQQQWEECIRNVEAVFKSEKAEGFLNFRTVTLCCLTKGHYQCSEEYAIRDYNLDAHMGLYRSDIGLMWPMSPASCRVALCSPVTLGLTTAILCLVHTIMSSYTLGTIRQP
jgi:hypothetical protein